VVLSVGSRAVKAISLLLIMILLVSISASLPQAVRAEEGNTGGKDGQKVALEKLIQHLESSIERVEGVINDEDIVLPDDIRANLTSAKNLLEEAEEEFERGNYNQTRELLLQAMRCLRVVTAYAGRQHAEEVREWARERVARGLEVAIRMHRAFLKKIEDMMSKVEDEGIEVPEDMKERVANAYKILEEAEAKLEEGMFNETARLLGESKREVAGICGEIHRLAIRKIVLNRIERMVNVLLKQQENIVRQILEKVKNVTKPGKKDIQKKVIGVVAKTCMKRLERIRSRLEELMRHLEERGYEGLEGIDQAISKIKEWMGQLNKLSSDHEDHEDEGEGHPPRPNPPNDHDEERPPRPKPPRPKPPRPEPPRP